MPPKALTTEQQSIRARQVNHVADFLATLSFPVTLLDLSLLADKMLGETPDAILLNAINACGLKLIRKGQYTVVMEV